MIKKSILSILLILTLTALSSKEVQEGWMVFKDSSSTILYVSEGVNCTPWNLQVDGCYERVCCCDSNGQHFCERCCPDQSGKCIAVRVKC